MADDFTIYPSARPPTNILDELSLNLIPPATLLPATERLHMPNEPTTITVGPMPQGIDHLPEPTRQELLARVAYAMDFTTVPAKQEHWPHAITVDVIVYHDPNPSDSNMDFHELHNLWFPANGHGFYSNDRWDRVWFQVIASWDEETASTINRDWYGNLQHWM